MLWWSIRRRRTLRMQGQRSSSSSGALTTSCKWSRGQLVHVLLPHIRHSRQHSQSASQSHDSLASETTLRIPVPEVTTTHGWSTVVSNDRESTILTGQKLANSQCKYPVLVSHINLFTLWTSTGCFIALDQTILGLSHPLL